MAEQDWYAVLQVAPDADAEVIAAAFRALSKKFHPDISGDAATVVQQQLIGEAYGVLSDSQKRALYDRERQAKQDLARQRPNPVNPDVAVTTDARRAPAAAAQRTRTEQVETIQARAAVMERQRQSDALERRQREAAEEQVRWRVFHSTQQHQADLAAQRLARKAAFDHRRNLALLVLGALLLLVAIAVVVRLTVLYSLQ